MLDQEAIAAVRDATDLEDDEEWREFYRSLDKDGSPCAYVFRCVHCGAWGGYVDYD